MLVFISLDDCHLDIHNGRDLLIEKAKQDLEVRAAAESKDLHALAGSIQVDSAGMLDVDESLHYIPLAWSHSSHYREMKCLQTLR